MTTMNIGDLTVDAIEYGSQGSAVLGIRDSGKTYTATLLAEKLFEAGIPFTAFDPIGVWRFLRVPGKGRGYPVVVAGGQAGDLPLTPASAPAIVEAAMQNGISLVVDLFSMDLSKGDWRRIVMESVRLMLHRNAAHGLRHVFLEEAAEFAPQILPKDGVTPAVYAEIEKLARMGGNARLGYTLINQRAEQVNKAVLELCDNLFLHRQKGKNSIKSLSKWLDAAGVADATNIGKTLPTLPQGECWAWLAGTDKPARIKVPAKNSLHPDRRVMRGDVPAAAAAPAVDVMGFVERMRGALADVEEEAKANDPKALKARIKELEKEVVAGRAGKPVVDHGAVARAWQEGAAAVRADMAGEMVALLATAEANIHNAVDAAFREILTELRESSRPAVVPKPATPAPVRAATAPVAPRRAAGNGSAASRPSTRSATTASLHAAARGILDVLAGRSPARFTWQQAATLAGLKARGGHFNAGRKDLREQGLIEEEGDLIRISDTGRALIGDDFTAPQGPSETRAMWRGKLPSPAPEMIDYLARQSDFVPKATMAEAIGKKPQGGHWNGGIAVLRNNGLIEQQGDRLRLCEELRGH